MLDDKFLEILINFREQIDYIINNKNIITEKNEENFLKELEKTRYSLFENIKINNKYSATRIDYINSNYKAEEKQGILKITIPEVLPKYKNVSNQAYKNIMMNVAEVSKQYANMFDDQLAFVMIIVHEKQKNMDIDNKYVKPILDGLVSAGVILDDNINNMFYAAMGKNDTKKPYTEVYVMKANYLTSWINELIKLF